MRILQRILKRVLKLTFLIFLLAACGLVVIRYFFADQIITAALQLAGASEVSVHLAAVGTDQVRFDFLTAAFALENGTTLHIQAKQINLQYDLQRLVQTKKCDLLTVQEMEISRTGESKSTAVPPIELPEKITLLKDSIRARLPIEKIRLEQVVLLDNLPIQLKDKEISLTASVSGTAFHATAILQADPETQLTLDFRSPDALHAIAELVGKRRGEEILRTKLDLQPDRLSGAINLQLQPVNALFLRSFSAETNIPIPEGTLDSTFSLPLPLRDDRNDQDDATHAAPLQVALTVIDSDNHQIHLEASGTPDARQASFLLTGQKGKQDFLKTTLNMEDQRISGSYSLHGDQLRSFLAPYLPSPLPTLSGKFSGTVDIPLPGHQEKWFKATAIASSLALPSLTASAAEMTVSGKMDGKNVQLDKDSTFHGSGLAFGSTSLQECRLDLAGDFSRRDDQLQLNFAKQQKIYIKGLKAGSTFIRELVLQPTEALRFALNLQNNAWSFDKNTLHAAPLAVRTGAVDITIGPLQCAFSVLRCTDSGPEIITKLSSPTLTITTPKGNVPLKKVAGNFQFQQGIITSKLQAEPKNIPGRIQAEVKHDLSGAAGFFTLRTDKRLDLNPEEVSLADLLSNWQFPFDLDKGSVFLESRGVWKPGKKFHLTLRTEVNKGSGYFQKFLFEGLKSKQDLILLPELRSQSEGKISVQRLISSIDVHDLSAKTALLSVQTGTQPEVQLRKLQAKLLQGSISSPEIRYDLNKQQGDFTVKARGVDLATLVNLMKVKEMHATGKISGDIPVTIRGKEISVGNGMLYNDPPGGEISYTAPETGVAGLSEYAIKAIRDFRYTSLKSTAQYAPSGELHLAVSLQGISPELDKSRPVHFNINIEQNLLTLLQGLQYSKGLSEKIDKRVRQRYRRVLKSSNFVSDQGCP